MQVFYTAAGRREPIIGVVGALQYDVITSRLDSEYGVSARIEPASFALARWVVNPDADVPSLGGGNVVGADRQERKVILFTTEWELHYFERHHPTIALSSESPDSDLSLR